MSDLITISYRSKAVLSDPTRDVDDIVAESHSRNEARGITGILLFDGEFFMQTIEGPAASTRALFVSIIEDDRHENVVPFFICEIEGRDFPDWHMEFLEPGETAKILPDMKKFNFSYRDLRHVQAIRGIAVGFESLS
jgi:hypothetical protein